MGRMILHIDMDAFFASVEQRDHEEYRGKPVIIGGLGTRGVVSTASYEARKFGVHSAMPMVTARRRCPDAIFLRGNHAKYSAVSRQIFSILARFSPVIEPLSIDEGFLDLTGMERLMENPRAYGEAIKRAVREETGLTASVGIAPNKFLAKLASDLEKPDGLVIIRPEDAEKILAPLPVSRIFGVGKKTEARLAALGLKTIGQLAAADRAKLSRAIGDRMAAQLFALAHGIDDRPVEPQRDAQSIGREETFGEDIHAREDAERVLLTLSEEVGWRLRREGLAAHTVTLKIRFAPFDTYTRQQTFPEPVSYDEDIFEAARSLFRAFPVPPGAGIRLLGVSAGNLSMGGEVSLFDDHEKKDRLYDAIDKLKGRFGENILTRAARKPPNGKP
ncbi:MAG: DNA polymerase IV [Schwartzia sp.]|nr:DNA polymerase IV [Schwartzia sp. (in: firmicutes)]